MLIQIIDQRSLLIITTTSAFSSIFVQARGVLAEIHAVQQETQC